MKYLYNNYIMKQDTLLPQEYQQAFKPADIRGVYPSQINEVVAYRTARAFVQLYGLKRVVLGRDMRLSSPALRKAFIAGVQAQGADVLDIGLVGTPALYYVCGRYNLPGAMITASHNPKEYNGIKLVEAGAIPLTDETGLITIQKLVVSNNFVDAKKSGKLKKKSFLTEYKKYVHNAVSIGTKKKINIVVDAGNGMGTTLAPILCKGLPLKIHKMFFKLDGTFPNRGSNPALAKNNKQIRDVIKKRKPDFGVAFDGDVDRVAFFDEKGKMVNSAVIGALIAAHMLRQKSPQTFVYTNFTSRSYEETVAEFGGKAIRARVGHAFIKNLMREKDAVFSCEHSAHFYFKSNFYTDSGIIALLKVAELYAQARDEGKTFSQLVKEFDRYHQTEEVLIKVSDKKKVLAKVSAKFKKMKSFKCDHFDGFHAVSEKYWFTLKESVTEDALKLIVEGPEKVFVVEKQKEILALLKK